MIRSENKTRILMVASLMLMAAIVPGRGLAQAPVSDTISAIQKIFAHWNQRTPGGVLQVTRNGETVYHGAFGSSNLEAGIPVTTETIFEAGSVSKQFTAAATLLLVQEGKIGLNDPITRYFPDFPGYGNQITIDMLLHHTSGLRDWGSVAGIGGWPRTTRVYTHALVRDIIWRQTATNFTPGSAYGYSNSNYSMLVFLVEKVSGNSLQAFTEARLFKPMGMKHTQWRDNFREIIRGRAQAYSGLINQYALLMPFENTFGHGGLLTTTEDLSKWNSRWQSAQLGAELNRLQQEKGMLANGKTIEYARGVSVGSYNGFTQISHSGATAGYRSWLAYYPEKALSVAYLSNDGGTSPTRIGDEVASLFLGREPERPKKPLPSFIATDSVQAIAAAGIYRSTLDEDILEFAWKNGALRMTDNNLETRQVDPNHFYADGLNFIFTGNGNGQNPGGLRIITPGGDTVTYRQMLPAVQDSNSMKTYEGRYASAEADAVAAIRFEQGSLLLYRDAGKGISLRPIYKDAFLTPDMELLEFRRHKKKISGFGWSVPRANNVWFRKEK
jgi:CubicO group peptidase (beta-lactamase class C family)